MKILRRWVVLLCLLFLLIQGTACSKRVNNSTVHVGYFPNIAHAQAVLGIANGTFATHLGPGVEIKTTLFNAGPSIIEAIFSGDLDIAYVGPSPAINGYVRSGGKALRVIAGASSGGSLFIIRPDSGIKKATDLSGKRIATPQLGNTQDIALRGYLNNNGLNPREVGGTVNILPLRNPDILNLFMRKQIDGAWVPEPWGARLIKEAGGEIFLDERYLWLDGRFCSTLMIVRTGFLEKHPDLVKQWLAAHIEMTHWINQYPKKARFDTRSQIKVLSGINLPEEIFYDAFSRIEFTYDPITVSLFSYAEMAYNAGFLKQEKPDLAGMVDLSILNEVLREQSLPEIGKGSSAESVGNK
ncbi:MAG TPA: ABC transporter substrate-binding protein [Candidatus Brocadiaceae bacterium]|nr:ABC transporter substrate-binding protein [Candidatus Brocadiaceae bacterium]